jgi:uncharacterized membrane protein YjjP (DUF1212 family)
MKKTILILTIIAFVAFAGSAFAAIWQGKSNKGLVTLSSNVTGYYMDNNTGQTFAAGACNTGGTKVYGLSSLSQRVYNQMKTGCTTSALPATPPDASTVSTDGSWSGWTSQ